MSYRFLYCMYVNLCPFWALKLDAVRFGNTRRPIYLQESTRLSTVLLRQAVGSTVGIMRKNGISADVWNRNPVVQFLASPVSVSLCRHLCCCCCSCYCCCRFRLCRQHLRHSRHYHEYHHYTYFHYFCFLLTLQVLLNQYTNCWSGLADVAWYIFPWSSSSLVLGISWALRRYPVHVTSICCWQSVDRETFSFP